MISVDLEVENWSLLIIRLEEVGFKGLSVPLEDLEQLSLISVSKVGKELFEFLCDMLSNHSLCELMHHVNGVILTDGRNALDLVLVFDFFEWWILLLLFFSLFGLCALL